MGESHPRRRLVVHLTLMSIALAVTVLLGVLASRWSCNRIEQQIKNDLLSHASALAKSVNIQRVKSLSFTLDDIDNPAFNRLSSQLISYAESTPIYGIFTMRMRQGKILFGPESYVEGHPFASPPGTEYEEPPQEAITALEKGELIVSKKPYTDEFGSFITAYAPVRDYKTGEILMVIGVDKLADELIQKLAAAKIAPVPYTLTMILLVLIGGAVFFFRGFMKESSRWHLRHFDAVFCLAVGLVITFSGSSLIFEIEGDSRRDSFHALSRAQAEGFSKSLFELRARLESIGRFFESSEEVNRSEFQAFAEPFTTDGVARTWGWAPAVKPEMLPDVIEQARKDGLQNFDVWQRDKEGNREPVSGRDTYYPLVYAEPAELNDSIFGIDLGFDVLRRNAINEALRTGMATATEPLILSRGDGSQRGIVVFRPVFDKGKNENGLRGFVVTSLPLDTALQLSMRLMGDERDDVKLELFQLSPESPPRHIASFPFDRSDKVKAIGISHSSYNEFSTIIPILVFGKTYALTAMPTKEWLRAHPSRTAMLAGGAGIILTLLLTAFVLSIAHRRAVLERLVAERTASLRENEELLSATLRSIGDGVITTNEQGNVTSLNNVAEELTGWRTTEARGKPIEQIFNIIHSTDRTPADIPVRKAIESGEIIGLANSTALISKNGTEKLIADSCAPIRNIFGKVVGAVLVFRDVTEEHRAKRELFESNERFKQISEQSREIIWEVDMNGLFTYISAACEQILGYSTDEIVGHKHFFDLASEEEQVYLKKAGLEFFAKCEVLRNFENRIVSKDGRIVTMLTNGVPKYDSKGKAIGYIGSDLDISSIINAQAELRDSEARLNKIVEAAQDAIIMIDNKGRITMWNEAATRIFGYTPSEVMGRVLHDFLAPEQYRKDYSVAFKDFQITGKGSAIGKLTELTALNKNGDEFAVEIALSSVLIKGKWHAVGILRDISERKKAEKELSESRMQYMLAVNGSNDGIWDWNLLNNDIFFSTKWKQMIGYADDELQNEYSEFESRIHPDDIESVMNNVRDYFEKKTQYYSAEFRFRHKSGKYIWVLARGEALRDEYERPYRMAGSHTDITERKLAEQALQKSERELKQLLMQMTNAFVLFESVYDENRNFVSYRFEMVNEAYERTTGVTFEQVKGKTVHEVWPDTEQEWVQEYSHTVKTGEPRSFERFHKPTNKFYYCNVYRPIEAMDKFCVVFEDITERKRAEEKLRQTLKDLEAATRRAEALKAEAEAANKAKSEFLANMSHEIRTPMNGVIGMTGLLLDTALSSEQRRYAEIVRSSGESLLSIINDILDFSKIEAGKLELEEVDFDIHNMLEELSVVHAVKAHEKGLELIFAPDPDLPVFVNGDPGRLRQVITNLVGNAIKFTHEGEVVVRASIESKHNSSAMIRFSVRDTGIGIPDDKQHLLFDSFMQVDASTTRKYGGTGLGLAISKQLAEMMGGRIGVNSLLGKGSEFWFTAKVSLKLSGVKVAEERPVADIRGAKVLVVDDNATNREILMVRLKSWGMKTTDASDAPEALHLLYNALDSDEPFDIAVLDMLMPGMDGEALGKAIRSDSKLKNLRLVMMTSMVLSGDAKRFADIGFNAYLTKPVRQSDLFDALASCLSVSEKEFVKQSTERRLKGYRARFSGRVLLAEDNIANQQVAIGILSKFGLHVDAVANGNEVLKALENIPYDLVLMDVSMPEMDGFETTRAIRCPMSVVLNSHIPIIAMTAHALSGDRERCIASGMNDYVAKPIVPEALGKALEKWMPEASKIDLGSLPQPREDAFSKASSRIVFDRAGFLRRMMNDEKLAREIVTIYLDDFPNQLDSLKNAVNLRDKDKIGRAAHLIKGSSANMGGDSVQSTAHKIEEANNNNDIDAIQRLMPQLEKQFEMLKDALLLLLQGL